MALDVYVMPLWRFKAGDFSTPIEENLGIKPTVLAIGESQRPAAPSPPWYLRLAAKIGLFEFTPESTPEQRKAAAMQEVDALKDRLTKLTNVRVEWPDSGAVQYKKQFYDPVVLRAFAAWCNHRDSLPDFHPAPTGNYYNHPVWKIAKPPHRRFATLIQHSLHVGYFLPVPFEGVYAVEPFMAFGREFHHHVASTQTILRELAELMTEFEYVAGPSGTSGGNPVADARWYAEELERICRLSVDHELPVIFNG
jgi:hypothetical protein